MKPSLTLCVTLLCVLSTSSVTAQTTTESTSTSQLNLEISQSTSTSLGASTSALIITKKPSNALVESYIKEFFKDTPVMISIAECESHFRQYADSGAVLGSSTSGMIGVFQIYGDVHKDYAQQKGYDIYSLEGNAAYAQYLYKKEGTNPWMDSFSCWKSATSNPESALTSQLGTQTTNTATAQPTQAPTQTITAGAFSTNVSFGMTHSNVLILQQILNSTGFTISQTGPGSPGNETTKFGSLTRDAVRRFQCAKQIVCTGDEGSTGYGYVGNRTRLALIGAFSQTSHTQAIITTSPSDTHKDQIASLEAQIQTLQNNIAALQAKIESLKAGQ